MSGKPLATLVRTLKPAADDSANRSACRSSRGILSDTAPLRTVRATVYSWSDDALAEKAWAIAAASEAPDGHLTSSQSRSYSEGRVRLWLRGPDCVRVEEDVKTEEGFETLVAATDGSAWFELDPEDGLLTSAECPHRRPDIGYPERYLFAASEVLDALEIVDTRKGNHRGRPSLRIRARPAAVHAPALYALGFGADTYSIDVDLQHPVLLRTVGEFAGKPFEILEVIEVVFDEDLPNDLFRRAGAI